MITCALWDIFHSQQVMSQFTEAEELEAILATQDLVAVGGIFKR